MSRNIILCIGSVTSKQYQEARLFWLRKKVKTSVTNVRGGMWMHPVNVLSECLTLSTEGIGLGLIDRQLVEKHFMPVFRELGSAEFTRQFEAGGWIEWFVGIRPDEVKAIVLGPEDSFDDFDSDFPTLDAIEGNISETWPDARTRPPVYRVNSDTGISIKD